MKHIFQVGSLFLILIVSSKTYAQTCDWDIEITPAGIVPSNCEKSGGFTVTFTGSDANQLENKILSASGPTTVTPNSSEIFVELSAGTYIVKVTANCPGELEEVRTKTVVVPGNYMAPEPPAYAVTRHALACGAFGRITVSSINGSSKPYTIEMAQKPDGYTGPTTFKTYNTSYNIENLIDGQYSFRIVDSCNFATVETNVKINKKLLSELSGSLTKGRFVNPVTVNPDCNTIGVKSPGNHNAAWTGYNASDTPIEFAIEFDGMPRSAYYPFYSRPGLDPPVFVQDLPSGKKLKDYYGKNDFYKMYVRVKDHPACGDSSGYLMATPINPVVRMTSTSTTCSNYTLTFSNYPDTAVCFPVSIFIKKSDEASGTNLVLQKGGSVSAKGLVPGDYTISYTSADGYTWTKDHTLKDPNVDPYAMTWVITNGGMNGYINKFTLTRKGDIYLNKGTKIELISGPPGYSYLYILPSNLTFDYIYISSNQAVPRTDPLSSFIPGDYVWEITDECGSYTLNVTLPESAVYRYTLDLSNQQKTCNSLIIKPKGKFTFKGENKDAAFKIIEVPSGVTLDKYGFTNKENIVLSTPGTYKIMVLGDMNAPVHLVDHEILYQYVTYEIEPLKIDAANSQGFTCLGSADNEGQISVKALGGMGSHAYSLYRSENDAKNNINLMSSNTTGDFSPTEGLNLLIDNTYYVKITDSCGSSVIQAFTILNLKNIRPITANKNSFCEGETLELKGLLLPSSVYTWGGPNGFTSTDQNPVRSNLSLADGGKYYLTIESPYCHADSKDTITVNIFEIPRKPDISPIVYLCKDAIPKPLVVTPDTDCIIKWFDSDGTTSLPNAPTPPTSPVGSTEYWLQQFSTVSDCKSEKIKVTVTVVENCLKAVDDHIFVFVCEKVTFDPLANDVIMNGAENVTVTFGTPNKGVITTENNQYIYTNQSCIEGEDEFTYTVCINNNEVCSSGKVFVSILLKPEIIIPEDCTITPRILINPIYSGGVHTWEKSEDGISGWTAVGLADSHPELNFPVEGFYRAIIQIPGYIPFYTQVKKLGVNKTHVNPIEIYQLWFE